MSRELSDLYRSLAAYADRREPGVPEVLRQWADRRARVRTVGVSLAVALVLGGVATGTQMVLRPQLAAVPAPAATSALPPQPATPTPTPSASPTAIGRPVVPVMPPASPPRPRGTAGGSPGGTTAPPLTRIPDQAFFALAPSNEIGVRPRFQKLEVLPDLCGARYPTEAAVVQRRTRLLVYKLPRNPGEGYVPDGSYAHTITIYRAGRADEVLDELRRMVRACPEQRRPGDAAPVLSRQRLLPDSGFGDDSVLFELRSASRDVNGDPTGGQDVRLVRAIRVGDVVTVLWEQGWENTSSQRAQVDADSRRAVAAIRSWVG
ncbi:hypothetical protein [Micromonospora sp. 067-2]|uniref:hypothetical protein n=1 Tax=Micromonospora sp. 067-2 TaxID=2789270 RepID=UPI00397E7206